MEIPNYVKCISDLQGAVRLDFLTFSPGTNMTRCYPRPWMVGLLILAQVIVSTDAKAVATEVEAKAKADVKADVKADAKAEATEEEAKADVTWQDSQKRRCLVTLYTPIFARNTRFFLVFSFLSLPGRSQAG